MESKKTGMNREKWFTARVVRENLLKCLWQIRTTLWQLSFWIIECWLSANFRHWVSYRKRTNQMLNTGGSCYKWVYLMNKDKFILDKSPCAGMVFAYGTSNYQEIITCGNQQEVICTKDGCFIDKPIPMTIDSIFDLSSVTKLLTCFTVMRLFEKKY